jgi:hypothetical protein
VFVDCGLEPDDDLIQVLIREVLEEEISTLIANQYLSDHALQIAVKPATVHENRSHVVRTPQPTPPDSPIPSPRHSFRPVTVQSTPRTSFEPKHVEPAVQPRPETETRDIPQVIQYNEDTESLFESSHDEQEEVEFLIDPQLIVTPKTPVETPRHSPSPPVSPPPRVQPRSELKYLV